MNTVGKDFRAAFGSIWALLGVLISAVAVFNFLSRVLRIGLSELFHQLLTAFRSVFHPILDFLLGWLPWAIPAVWKDGLVLWFAVGGAVLRTFLGLQLRMRQDDKYGHQSSELIIGSVLSFFVWPFMLWNFFREPIVLHRGGFFQTRAADIKYDRGLWQFYERDLRVVFLMQLTAVLAAASALVLLNAAGVS